MVKVKGFYLQVDGIPAHIIAQKTPSKKTVEALAALVKAAHKHTRKEAKNNGR
jgi:hypothetical protein